jgi:hypothetical protein
MTPRQLGKRLRHLGRRLRDRAHARLTALCAAPLRPCDVATMMRLFCGLTSREAVEGTPLEIVLGRLPPGLAREIRREVGAVLAAEGAAPSRSQWAMPRRAAARESNRGPRRLDGRSIRHPTEQDVETRRLIKTSLLPLGHYKYSFSRATRNGFEMRGLR